MVCPKCNSDNVSVQAVTTMKTQGKSIWWWLFISWWIWIVWLLAFLPMLIIKIFKGKKVKSKTHTEAICQSCGNRWRV